MTIDNFDGIMMKLLSKYIRYTNKTAPHLRGLNFVEKRFYFDGVS